MKYNLPTGYLSATQVTMHIRCGLQYYKRYVEKKKRPPGIALVEGSSHHASLEYNNKYKIKQHEDRKVKQLVSRFEDEFDTRNKEVEDWGEDTVDTVIKRGRVLLPKYLKRFAPFFQPSYVERRFTLLLQAVPFVCILDAAGQLRLPTMGSRSTAVVDYKVVKRTQSAATLDSDIVMSAYGWGAEEKLGLKSPIVGFCNLKKTKTPQIEWKPGIITPGRLRWFRRLVLDRAKSISAGNFPLAKPDEWYCSKKFCGFWDECRGKTERKRKVFRGM